MKSIHLSLLSLVVGLWSGCQDSSFFTVGRDLQTCEENIPTTDGKTARCLLDENHYPDEKFPGGMRFLVRTIGEADVSFELYLEDRKAPGTTLTLDVFEPNGSERHFWDSGGRDIFRIAGSSGIIDIDLHVTRPGDHLVELMSDAYCSYILRFSTSGS
jgi:hypothetical protein